MNMIDKQYLGSGSRMATVLSALLFIFCFSAIAYGQSDTTTATNGDGPGSARLTDENITNAIDLELIESEGVSANAIDVSAADGVVTLTGDVDNILAKERAADIASMVKGVRSIVNNIDVASAEQSDQQIKQNIEQALLMNPATEALEVDVSVNDGKVDLSGEVDSWQEHQLAKKAAKRVKGVREVTSDITYDPHEDRPDSEIAADIKQALRWDARIDDALIDVSVNDGEVTLSGTVGSAFEKRQAEIKAFTEGVSSIDANQLEVEGWARDESLRTDKYTVKSDSAIREAVKDALLYDPRVYAFQPKVKVDGGRVTLTGTVGTLEAKRAAEQDAKNTVGVFTVTNLLKVRPDDMPSDSTIRQNVATALTFDPVVERYEIDVNVYNGEVDLLGTVDTYYEKRQAEDAAARVEGVTVIDNNLMVEADYAADYYEGYYLDGDPIYAYTYEVTPAANVNDAEIREDIESQLWWSPFVNEDEVNIEVDNGDVTLTGTVDTWSEKASATENAFEGGAITVDNNLEVEYDAGS